MKHDILSLLTGTDPDCLRRRRKILLWLAGAVALYSAVGFFALPAMLRYIVAAKVATAMQRPITVARIAFNPYTLALTVNQLQIHDRQEGKPFVGFKRLYVNLEAASLLKGALIVRFLQLEDPTVSIVRNGDGSYNFSDLIAGTGTPDDAEAPGKSALFSLNNIEISGGMVDFQDLAKGTVQRLRDLHLALPFVANLDYLVETFVTPSFSADVNGSPLKLVGRVKPFVQSRESEVEVHFSGIDLTRYLVYLPPGLGVGLRSGSLDGDLAIGFVQKGDGGQLTLGGTVSLQDTVVTGSRGDDLFTLKRLAITLLPSDLLRGDIHLAAIELDAPHLLLKRRPDNSLNLQDLLAAGGSGEDSGLGSSPETKFTGKIAIDRVAVSRVAVTSEEKGDGEDVPGVEELIALLRLEVENIMVDCEQRQVRVAKFASLDGMFRIRRGGDGRFLWDELVPAVSPGKTVQEKTDTADGWGVNLAHLELAGYGFEWQDFAAPQPATLVVSDLSLQADNLSTVAATQADLSLAMQINGDGGLKVGGQLGLAPLTAGLDMALVGLAIKPFSPYLAEQLDVLVAGGVLSANGRLELAANRDRQPLLRFQGEAAVDDLATRDPLLAEPLLAWHSLGFAGIDLAVAPTALRVDAVTLDQPYVRLVISEKGEVNFAAALKSADATGNGVAADGKQGAEDVVADKSAAAGESEQEPPLLQINAVSCRNGRFDFEDRSIPSGYKVSLGEFSGKISGLSSLADQVAQVDFRGKIDQHSPLAVRGTVNPLRKELWADLVVASSDIGLSAFSPYTGKYIGYRLDKGKLGFDLRYRLAGRQLDGENRVFMDQLTLGQSVDSPDALNLPIRLAIALLQNRAGEIKLDVPVSGNIDNPEFSLAGTIVGVFVNVIAKAVTSPFALLGALVGGGEELQFVEFAPGQALLAETGREKLASLATVLADRPALNLDITGWADAAQDRQELHDLFFQRLLKAEKLKKVVRESREDDLIAVDQVEIAPDEYPKYLLRAYKAASFKRPRNILGLLKKQPVAEMERLLRENIVVSDADRLDLASRRAAAVQNFLIKEGGIAAERLFVLDAKLEGDGSGPVALRRVGFAVR